VTLAYRTVVGCAAMKLTRTLVLRPAARAALVISLLAVPTRPEAAPPVPPPAPTPAAAAASTCKAFGGGKCCSPDVTLHLKKEDVFAACGQSEATYLGEVGSKDTCKYVFKVAGENEDSTYVQVYSPIVKEVLDKPTDPFMSFKKVGKVWVTDKAKSPKAQAQVASSTGLYMAGRGFFVSVSASAKVCTKNQAIQLSKAIK
jgi:hypothetical protein